MLKQSTTSLFWLIWLAAALGLHTTIRNYLSWLKQFQWF